MSISFLFYFTAHVSFSCILSVPRFMLSDNACSLRHSCCPYSTVSPFQIYKPSEFITFRSSDFGINLISGFLSLSCPPVLIIISGICLAFGMPLARPHHQSRTSTLRYSTPLKTRWSVDVLVTYRTQIPELDPGPPNSLLSFSELGLFILPTSDRI
jgi:hypothetical protein